MSLTVKLDKNGINRIKAMIERPISQTRSFFGLLGLKMDQNTQLNFRLLGARSGHKKWLNYNLGKGHILGGSTRSKTGLWKIRYIHKPKRTRKELAEYIRNENISIVPGRPLRGYESERRYSPSSKLLQNTGQFRASFKVLAFDRKHVRFGSEMKNADVIQSHGREVIFVTNTDLREWAGMFRDFVDRNMI